MFKLQYVLVRILDLLLPLLSFSLIEKFANFTAFLLREIFRFRRDIVKTNLDMVFKSEYPMPYNIFLKKIYQNFAYMWFELMQVKKINRRNFDNHFTVHNIDLLERVLKKNKGVIFVMGHLGSFEWTMPFFGIKGYNLKVIMRKLKNPFVNKWVIQTREQFGCKTVYARKAAREGFKILKERGILEVIGDQYAGKKGIKIDFLGLESSTAIGTAVFHIKTQAPLIFVAFIRSKYGYFDVYFEEIKTQENWVKTDDNIKKITQLHTKVLEKWIRKYPDQWYWVHKRWKKRKKSA